jgi:hypothetical protein
MDRDMDLAIDSKVFYVIAVTRTQAWGEHGGVDTVAGA